MKLPIPFLSSKKKSNDYFLALVLSDEKASALILRESEGALRKISSHEEYFPSSVEDLDLEAFITTVDQTISRAEEVLPPDIETHQTVFGVKERWVDKDTKKIKKEYLEKLKKVCDALDLSPVGFMVTTEAITHLIQDDESAPLSAILAEIGKKSVTLSLLRGGKVVETVTSHIAESAPATVDRLLGHFTVPVLPARIVLFHHKPTEQTQQAFIAHQWSKSLPFLHMPQVTILPDSFDTRAVMYGAATQMGFTVVDPDSEPLPKATKAETKEENAYEEATEDLPQVEEAEEQNEEDELDNLVKPEDEPKSAADGGDFGFVVDGKPSDNLSEPTNEEPKHQAHHEAAIERDEEAEEERPRARGKKAGLLANLPPIALPKGIKLPKVDKLLGGIKGDKSKLKIIIPVVAVILLIIGLSIFYINGVKATVALTVAPNMVDQEETVVFSTTAPSDYSQNVVAARAISATIDGEVSTDATGKKDVGEKAKGAITIYNNSDDPAKLGANTEIKANNGQVFLLDKEVQVPAAKGDIFTGTQPGTADTTVTAKELGTEGNLPSGTRFTISSDLAARNDNAFSGGTKKNVTVVSKDDLAKLRAELPKKVQTEAKSKLAGEAESGETVLPVVGAATLQGEKFDKKEGDEAKKVTLKATVAYAGIAYDNEEFHEYAQSVLKSKYNQDVTLADNSIKEEVMSATLKDAKSASARVTLRGGLLPKIDTQDVIENVQDKSLSEAKETIGNLPQVAETDITFSPPIPLLPNLFPRLPNQIEVEVKAQE